MEAIAEEQERIRKGKMHRTENTSADTAQTKSEITTRIPFVGFFVQRDNNLQTEEITLTHQQTSIVVDKTPSKRPLAQRARREKERQIAMMDVIINNTLENTGENSDDCGVAPSETLGIDETSNTATTLIIPIAETEESSRGPIDIVNEPPQETFMDEHFFNDDNMDSNFEFNVDPLIYESRHYLGKMDVECPS
ncbi:hypothetical protein GIB67_020658 [Kingdonia uniflora]|uniref:Uncharacterized protein n=1 Tax=Kingdonia uniflora TaxID=39325 RepID=A0A7J7M9J0_9MAGN|nr:hypothetical protein GIB67_020658 [Kingdonia uniflora]